MNSFLSVMHLSKSYGGDRVLQDVTLRFPATGFIAIVGPSGSGKSTLLSLLSGQVLPDKGSVFAGEEELTALPEERRSSFRLQNIGMVFQKDELLECETALDNVLFPLSCLSKETLSKRKEKAMSLLFLVKMEKKAKQKAKKLSGGERQRVSIARALAASPSLLLADEPTSALDETNARLVYSLLKRLSSTRLVIMVTHDGERAKEYVDRIVALEDGKVVSDRPITQEKDPPLFLPAIDAPKRKPSLSWKVAIQHGKRKKKETPFRSLCNALAMTFGLLGLGLSVYVSSSITKQMGDVFASIVPPSTIVMEPASKPSDPETIELGTILEAKKTQDAFPSFVKGIGKTLLYDFESSFPDDNAFYYENGASLEMLEGFGIRSINDFLWLREEDSTYPSPLGAMGVDEVVLGLPFANMARLCSAFGLLRGYANLGAYCEQGTFLLTLRLANLSWNLSEELLFRVIGVKESPMPCFYHASIDWNDAILCDTLRFLDIGDGVPGSPQEARSIPFLEIEGKPSAFLKEARKEEGLASVAFDFVNADYAPSLCPLGTRVSLNRLYVFRRAGRGIPYSLFDRVKQAHPSIKGRLPISNGGFFGSTESALIGFSGRFFLTKSQELSDLLEKTYRDLPLEQAGLLGDMPEGTVEGSLLSSGSKGLRISANLEGVRGKKPEETAEVVLSTALFLKLGEPEKVNVLAEVGSAISKDTFSRHFEGKELTVVGTKEEESDVLYVKDDWTIDFFVDDLLVSPLQAEPRGAVFYLDENEDASRLSIDLEKAFPGFLFASPSALVEESLGETTDYIGVVLLFFSLISLLSSAFLFLLTLSLSTAESAREGRTLFALGLSRNDILLLQESRAILDASSSCFSAVAGILAAEIFVSLFLSFSFGTPLRIRFSSGPVLIVVFASLVLCLFAGLCLKARLQKGDFASRR